MSLFCVCLFLLVSHVYVSLCQLCFLLLFVCLLCVRHVCIYVPICISACTCIFGYISAFAPVVHVCVCMFISACPHVHVSACACCMHEYLHVSLCVCVCIADTQEEDRNRVGVEADTPQMSVSLLSSEGRAARPLTPSRDPASFSSLATL